MKKHYCAQKKDDDVFFVGKHTLLYHVIYYERQLFSHGQKIHKCNQLFFNMTKMYFQVFAE